MREGKGSPRLLVVSRQRAVAYDHALLEVLLQAALPLCRRVADELGGPLAGLPMVECSVLGRREMSRIHREFLGLRGPTDVITFPYGEIAICAAVAAGRAPEFQHTITEEMALYGIHGLLHLAGHDDHEPSAAKRMHIEQTRILQRVMKTELRVEGLKRIGSSAE